MAEQKNAPLGAYDVGYKKPPAGQQFKKGESGNSRGRPKGSRNFEGEVKSAFGRKVVIQENGRPRRITMGQAMLMKLTAKAVGGDMGALRLAIGLLQMTQPVQAPDNVFDSEADRALLMAYLGGDATEKPPRRRTHKKEAKL